MLVCNIFLEPGAVSRMHPHVSWLLKLEELDTLWILVERGPRFIDFIDFTRMVWTDFNNTTQEVWFIDQI